MINNHDLFTKAIKNTPYDEFNSQLSYSHMFIGFCIALNHFNLKHDLKDNLLEITTKIFKNEISETDGVIDILSLLNIPKEDESKSE